MSDDGWTTSANGLRNALAHPSGSASTTPLVIDARGLVGAMRSHIRGAVHLSWLTHRDGRGRTGKLPQDLAALRTRLAHHGIGAGRPIIVYGAASHGWGEEGRIAWMLRYLGCEGTRVLDGGIDAWRAAGGELAGVLDGPGQGVGTAAQRELTAAAWNQVRGDLRASIEDVQQAVDDSTERVLIVDTRSTAEWRGSRRYWPARGGRIPGAVHVEWRSLLQPDGTLDRSPAALARLARAGLTRDRPVITYCVGGVRSAHSCIALRALGFADVRNYDGSWYEWAADRTRPIETPPTSDP